MAPAGDPEGYEVPGDPSSGVSEGGSALESIKALGESLGGLLQAIQQAGAPKEVIGPLQASVQAYQQFMQAMGGGGGAAPSGAQPMSQTSMQEGANKNAQQVM